MPLKPGDPRVQRLVRRYADSDESVAEVGQAFGVTDRTVYRWVRRQGGVKRCAPTISKEDAAGMVALYQEGWATPDIAAKYNCHVWSVLRRLRKAGIKLRRGRAAHRR